MSVQLDRSLQEIRTQFEQDTLTEVQDAKTQGQKLINEVGKQVRELRQTCESLLKDTEAQLAKGKERLSKTRKGGDYWRTVKLANELGKETTEGIETVEIPDEVSYDGLRALANSLAPFLTKVLKTKRNYDPYITPYFIRARRSIGASLSKLHELVKEIGEFTSTTYRKVYRIEKTLEGIDRLKSLLENIPPINDLLAQENAKIEGLMRQIGETEETHIQLTEEPPLKEIVVLDQEIKAFELKAFKKLRIFRDPLKKMFYRSTSGGLGLSAEKREVAEGYIENALETFLTEDLGHPVLSTVLTTLKTSLEQETVSLKKRKETKTIQIIEEILDKGALQKIQKNIAELEAEKKKIMDTDQFQALKSREDEILAKIEELKATQTKQQRIVEKTEKEKEQKLQQIERLAERISKNIQKLSGRSQELTLTSLIN